jgi:hypothetical protein
LLMSLQVMSLRSSERRRLAALRGIEGLLYSACQQENKAGSLNIPEMTIQDIVQARGELFLCSSLHTSLVIAVYQPILSLLTRHAQTLSQRAHASSLPVDDEIATALIPELQTIVGILQGLCLLSRSCKAAVSESWVLEVGVYIRI